MAYTDYSSLFPAAEQKYGLPPGTLGGVGYVESRFNPKAVSPAGAQGMMQFMPATAKNVGLSNPFDPAASVDAAGNLLQQNLKATGGDIRKALMMYNAGTNPAKWNPQYADSVLSHAQQFAQPPQQANPYTAPPPAPGDQPMPPQTLGGMAGLQPQQPLPQMQAPQSLGDLASSMPQGNIPVKQPSKFSAGNILGVLGDSLMAYGGMRPSFAPFMQEQKILGQQQNFEREKFQQELQMRMYAMLHPEEFIKADMLSHMDPSQQYPILHGMDLTNPIQVSTPQGTQNVPRTQTRVVDGKTYYSVGGKWYEMGAQ